MKLFPCPRRGGRRPGRERLIEGCGKEVGKECVFRIGLCGENHRPPCGWGEVKKEGGRGRDGGGSGEGGV